jgi:hypothetical protein
MTSVIWKMRQQILPHRLFATDMALPDIWLGLPFAPGMTTFSTRKFFQQNEIYTHMPSNANAPLTVKGRYFCPGVLGGALCDGTAYSLNTNMLCPRRRLAQQVYIVE